MTQYEARHVYAAAFYGLVTGLFVGGFIGAIGAIIIGNFI